MSSCLKVYIACVLDITLEGTVNVAKYTRYSHIVISCLPGFLLVSLAVSEVFTMFMKQSEVNRDNVKGSKQDEKGFQVDCALYNGFLSNCIFLIV